MANIQKRGDTYRIRVSCGYDGTGKQLFQSMTYKPKHGMTERQIKKELERQAVLFEEQCRDGLSREGNTRLSAFLERWFSDYAEKQLKTQSVAGYQTLAKRVNSVLGNLPMNKIKPTHILTFYNKLEGAGIREDGKYIPVPDFAEKMKKKRLTAEKLSELSGVSIDTITSCRTGKTVSKKTADKISAAFGVPSGRLFEPKESGKKLTSNSISHYHRFLSSVFTTAVQWQVIKSNPCARVKPPRVEQKEAAYLDEVQAVHLLECLEGEELKYKVMVNIALYSGVRRGELCGLMWDDIDFNNHLITIERALLYTHGRGTYIDTPKNQSSKRVIKLPPEVFQLLREYKLYYQGERLKAGNRWEDTGFLFVQWNGKPIYPGTFTAWFSEFVKRNDLPHITVHSLRHTNATLLIANGTNLRTVSKRLGHSNMTTTGNIYTHAIKTADEMAAETLSGLLAVKKSKSGS